MHAKRQPSLTTKRANHWLSRCDTQLLPQLRLLLFVLFLSSAKMIYAGTADPRYTALATASALAREGVFDRNHDEEAKPAEQAFTSLSGGQAKRLEHSAHVRCSVLRGESADGTAIYGFTAWKGCFGTDSKYKVHHKATATAMAQEELVETFDYVLTGVLTVQDTKGGVNAAPIVDSDKVRVVLRPVRPTGGDTFHEIYYDTLGMDLENATKLPIEEAIAKVGLEWVPIMGRTAGVAKPGLTDALSALALAGNIRVDEPVATNTVTGADDAIHDFMVLIGLVPKEHGVMRPASHYGKFIAAAIDSPEDAPALAIALHILSRSVSGDQSVPSEVADLGEAVVKCLQSLVLSMPGNVMRDVSRTTFQGGYVPQDGVVPPAQCGANLLVHLKRAFDRKAAEAVKSPHKDQSPAAAQFRQAPSGALAPAALFSGGGEGEAAAPTNDTPTLMGFAPDALGGNPSPEAVVAALGGYMLANYLAQVAGAPLHDVPSAGDHIQPAAIEDRLATMAAGAALGGWAYAGKPATVDAAKEAVSTLVNAYQRATRGESWGRPAAAAAERSGRGHGQQAATRHGGTVTLKGATDAENGTAVAAHVAYPLSSEAGILLIADHVEQARIAAAAPGAVAPSAAAAVTSLISLKGGIGEAVACMLMSNLTISGVGIAEKGLYAAGPVQAQARMIAAISEYWEGAIGREWSRQHATATLGFAKAAFTGLWVVEKVWTVGAATKSCDDEVGILGVMGKWDGPTMFSDLERAMTRVAATMSSVAVAMGGIQQGTDSYGMAEFAQALASLDSTRARECVQYLFNKFADAYLSARNNPGAPFPDIRAIVSAARSAKVSRACIQQAAFEGGQNAARAAGFLAGMDRQMDKGRAGTPAHIADPRGKRGSVSDRGGGGAKAQRTSDAWGARGKGGGGGGKGGGKGGGGPPQHDYGNPQMRTPSSRQTPPGPAPRPPRGSPPGRITYEFPLGRDGRRDGYIEAFDALNLGACGFATLNAGGCTKIDACPRCARSKGNPAPPLEAYKHIVQACSQNARKFLKAELRAL